MFAFYFLTACTTLKGVFGVSPSYNGLGLTPQMGWDSWNTFACDVSEQLLLDTADRISDLGLKDMGYKYVILDDCWSSGRGFRRFPRCRQAQISQRYGPCCRPPA
ncbi:AHL_G0017770.mRNA.1.CDS.1 [Saccharomyces cerevisiae]|nr:AHL_G0017770.mRNA.1.CDS.1 [Saccharomyces cerevisiae]CAI6651651.1 AHL_G0017770.mRNA.1.CDS.1 [Saccharomyces cerevisiae]